jgi:CTP synthase
VKLKIKIKAGSLAYKIYGKKNIEESFNCNYELNREYRKTLESHGLVVSGVSSNNGTRIIELPTNDFFIATGFLPQMDSQAGSPHPLFTAFIKIIMVRKGIPVLN